MDFALHADQSPIIAFKCPPGSSRGWALSIAGFSPRFFHRGVFFSLPCAGFLGVLAWFCRVEVRGFDLAMFLFFYVFPAEQMFWEVMQLRKEMSFAKLGFYREEL